jgi:NAD(P)-dependent dehydrogenase (short-subunit alcohol dehydrogenase family)
VGGRLAAIITGASAGIGKAVACRLAALDWSVLLVGRDDATLSKVVEEVAESGGGQVSGFVGDVSDERTAAGYTAACLDRYGAIDAFLNNAAYEGALGPVEDAPVDDFDRLVAVNLRGAFLGLRQVVPVMKRAGCGRIVNVSSQAGVRGVAGCAGYSASKHAVIGLSQSVALEVARDGISVNVVCPGPTDTTMIARVEAAVSASGGDPASIAKGIPNGRYGRPDEVASSMVWLLADCPPHLTGAVVSIDGGMTAA